MPKNTHCENCSGEHHSEPLKHANKVVVTLSLVSLFLAATLLLSLIYLNKMTFVQNSLPYRPLPTKTTAQKPKPGNKFTILSLIPSSLPLKVGQTGTLNLSMQTGANLVSGVEFTLNFDPAKFEILSATPASFFAKPNVLASKIDNKKGTLYYAIGTFTPKSGNDNLVTFVLKGKSIGQSKLTFSPDTKVAAKNEGVLNVLKEIEGSQITISQ